MAKRKKKNSASLLTIALAALLLFVFKNYIPNDKESDQEASHSKAQGFDTKPAQDRTEINKKTLEIDENTFTKSKIRDFDSAKNELRRLFSRGKDFYCSCSYDFTRRPHVDPSSCGLVSKSDRAKRIEWEHVVPASFYGRQFVAWKKGDPSCHGRDKRGRECARKVSPVFRQIEGDLYNLVPAVGELNGVRGDNNYGEIPGEPREYGACDFETLANVTEPKSDIRGDIARIYFYMDARYPDFGIVNPQNQTMLEQWALADPMDSKEEERVRKIEAVQGNSFFIGRLAQNPSSSAKAGQISQ